MSSFFAQIENNDGKMQAVDDICFRLTDTITPVFEL